MFGIYNFSCALARLNDKETNDLSNYSNKNPEKFMNSVTQLIAMCHHRPVDNKVLKAWIKDKFKKDIYTYGHAKTYGKASKNNYESL